MDSFMESLNRLKEAHEKEVLGLQNKLLELNSERCRDTQRVEELFTKNQQLREQQKVLKENLRVLENRLRAGLCDRCMVTQELARKKQTELESAHLQSLQHLCILTNEMNELREENKTLKEEVNRLRSLGDKPTPLGQESNSDPTSPLPLPSPGGWKGATENPPGGSEEAEEDQSCAEKPAGHRMSPVARISPGTSLPEPRALDMSSQCISNQLHSTVAVVRPGSRACPADRSPANGTPPPLPARSRPPSPAYEHSLPLDSFLRGSRPSAAAYDALKRSLQADRLRFLNHHLSLRLLSPGGSPLAPPPAARSPRPQGKAGEMEAWEEPRGLPGLPRALASVRDPRLEGALHLLLAQARADSARLRGPATREKALPSPPASSDSDSSGSEDPRSALSSVLQPGHQQPQPTGPRRKEMPAATQDCVLDKPLDLSDRGRARDAPKSVSPTAAHTPSLQLLAQLRPLTCNPLTLSNGTKGTRTPEPEEPSTLKEQTSPPSPGRTAGETGRKPSSASQPQRPDIGGHSAFGKARVQRSESEESGDSDTADSEVGLRCEAGARSSMSGQEQPQGLQQKRKRTLDHGDKASKNPSQGKKKLREPPTEEGPRSPRTAKDHSPSPNNSGQET